MSGKPFDIDQVCEKCKGKMKAKTITINYWYRGTCENAGVKSPTVVFCPECDPEPQDRIEHVGAGFDLF